MLGLFSSNRAAHPLADDDQRAKLLATLAGSDSAIALYHATELLRGVAPGEDLSLSQRETIIRQIDDVAHHHARVLGREYLTMAHLSDEEELRLWRANRDFWAQLGAGYYGCITEAQPVAEDDAVRRVELARLTVRLLRAYAARLKWDQFRYWPASEAVWQIMGRAYLFAHQGGFARREVAAYHGERHPSTVEQEYLKVLVFQISATDSLLPFEIEIAERVIAFFLPRFSLAQEARPGYAFCVDPEQRRAPTRFTEGMEVSESMRHFSTAEALMPLDDLRHALEQGIVPPHLELARYRSPRIILPVVRHLAGYWSFDSPKREHDRHRVRSQTEAVIGMKSIIQRLRHAEDSPPPALWSVENVSQGGLRARLPIAESHSLHIGTLVGMCPQGGENWLVGVVRRFSRESGDQASAGIQTLSKRPLPIEVEAADGRIEGLVLDAPDEGELVRVVLPSGTYVADKPVAASLVGAALQLEPVELGERGGEFDLVRYRVMVA